MTAFLDVNSHFQILSAEEVATLIRMIAYAISFHYKILYNRNIKYMTPSNETMNNARHHIVLPKAF